MRDLPAQVGSLRILYRYPGLILLKSFTVVNLKDKEQMRSKIVFKNVTNKKRDQPPAHRNAQ